MSSSYFEGVTCPLAAFGHNRDRKKRKLQVNYGLLTSAKQQRAYELLKTIAV